MPIVRLKSYAINAFIMGCHFDKKNWSPSIGDELQGFMEPINATNAGDGLGMKVPCQLFFLVEEKFIIILQEKNQHTFVKFKNLLRNIEKCRLYLLFHLCRLYLLFHLCRHPSELEIPQCSILRRI